MTFEQFMDQSKWSIGDYIDTHHNDINDDAFTAALMTIDFANKEIARLNEIIALGTFDNPDFGDYSKASMNFMNAWLEGKDKITALKAENVSFRSALEIIAGTRPCLDNLMSNVDVAKAALEGQVVLPTVCVKSNNI